MELAFEVLAQPLDFGMPTEAGLPVPADPLIIARLVVGEARVHLARALAALHENYLRCGIRERDDTTYMRRFRPDFTRNDARW